MARNAEQQKIFNKERYIGRKAAKMAQDYVLQLLKQKLHIRNQGDPKNDIKPILEATKVKAKMGDYRLLGLDFSSSKVGFIQHFGFKGIRQGGQIYLEAARYHKKGTERDAHSLDIQSKEFFNEIYEKSGAIDYLINALGETRIEGEIIKIRQLLSKLQIDNGR